MLQLEIKTIFDESKGTYGSPRIHEELKKLGKPVSRRRIAKLMRVCGLKSRIKRKFRITTNSKHPYPIAENLLDRNFNPANLNEVWVSDITYIKTNEGWLYLTIILDLCDRQVIGWALSRSLKTIDTIIPAWNMALSKRKITENLIFHSDRGVQYACKEFRELLEKNPFVTQSMSRKGNCWDNAVAESFFKTLKVECVYQCKYNTVNDAKLSVFEYIEVWYNRKRIHSSLGYKTPMEFEKLMLKIKYAA